MKIARHAQIIKLIHQYDIETQEELAAKLNESGFSVTQATVSRDIRELKLTKVQSENGGVHYAVMQNQDPVSYTHLDVYKRQGWNGRKAGDERNPSGRILPDLQRRHGAVEKMQ